MLDLHAIKAKDLKALSPADLAELAAQMLAHIGEQTKHIGEQRKQIDSQAQAIKWRDVKIESVTFQLARFKAWKFGAKTEAMNAEQREIFEETCAADQADLEAQLAELQRQADAERGTAPQKQPRRQPKREALPPHLPRVDQRVEPEDTNCPTPECGQPMVRVGEDISERLDIVPAQFFVQRQIRGKWACKCCQLLVQEPAAPQVFDNALPTPGLQAHTVVSRFVDHIPYYRQEQINARAGVHTPRSTLASWGGQTGAQLMPLYRRAPVFVLGSRSGARRRDADRVCSTPARARRRRPTCGPTREAPSSPDPGVVFDFCLGRGGKYPTEFLKGWSGHAGGRRLRRLRRLTLSLDGRSTAYCLAHARRKFDELVKAGRQRESGGGAGHPAHRLAVQDRGRRQATEQRAAAADAPRAIQAAVGRVASCGCSSSARVCPTGSAIAKAIDYSLNHWLGLGRFLLDGDVPIDNNHMSRTGSGLGPLGGRNWLFIGSQLAGERAAVVMSLLQSAKLNGHDPFAYLKDVLTRLPTQLNSRIEELLPHRWKPAD